MSNAQAQPSTPDQTVDDLNQPVTRGELFSFQSQVQQAFGMLESRINMMNEDPGLQLVRLAMLVDRNSAKIAADAEGKEEVQKLFTQLVDIVEDIVYEDEEECEDCDDPSECSDPECDPTVEVPGTEEFPFEMAETMTACGPQGLCE